MTHWQLVYIIRCMRMPRIQNLLRTQTSLQLFFFSLLFPSIAYMHLPVVLKFSSLTLSWIPPASLYIHLRIVVSLAINAIVLLSFISLDLYSSLSISYKSLPGFPQTIFLLFPSFVPVFPLQGRLELRRRRRTRSGNLIVIPQPALHERNLGRQQSRAKICI